MKIAILAFTGVDELDLFGVYSILTKANSKIKSESKWLIEIISLEDSILTSKNFAISTRKIIAPFFIWDILVLLGGSAAKKSSETGYYDEFIRLQLNSNTKIYAICSGILFLRNLGHLKNKTVACHAEKKSTLKNSNVRKIVPGLIRDGRLTSIGGTITSSIKSVDIGFEIVRSIAKELLPKLEKQIETKQGRFIVEYKSWN